ncbi:hypothetical protein [Croceicoccus sp. BE223]|uniref:hypothetical protein n=1 Tax=Croceicoccus sp. BE223 TaxID=2817716 RepID=UPI00285FA24E|nr:hypothetical protein [Croceicoccus sp. BE223]MDR7102597.1 hypothetical protein [Croceicoccus sp. BE223]
MAATLKPLYCIQLSTIAVLLAKKPFPLRIWRYEQAELWSLAALVVALFFLFKFQSIWLGFGVGVIGIAHICVIHFKYIAALREK